MHLWVLNDDLGKTLKKDVALLMYYPGISLEGLRIANQPTHRLICDMFPPGFDLRREDWWTSCSLSQPDGSRIYSGSSVMDRIGGLFLKASCWSEKPPLSTSTVGRQSLIVTVEFTERLKNNSRQVCFREECARTCLPGDFFFLLFLHTLLVLMFIYCK
jgi:hypothetical protein